MKDRIAELERKVAAMDVLLQKLAKNSLHQQDQIHANASSAAIQRVFDERDRYY